MLRKILLAAAVPLVALGVQWGATANAAVKHRPVTYKCVTTYEHRLAPIPDGGAHEVLPLPRITEENVSCLPNFTGELIVTVSGGREKSVAGGWTLGSFSNKRVPFRVSGTLSPSDVSGYTAADVTVNGTVPFSYLPKITITSP
jgi:hypothetical protein